MINIAFLDVVMEEPITSSFSAVIIGIVVIAVAVAAFFIIRAIKNKKNKQ